MRDAVVAEDVEPIAAKGKAEPVEAHLLISVRTGVDGRARHLESRLIGRELEVARLDEVYRRAVTDRTCQLFTLLAPAGVGKSRLTEAFLASIDGEATLLRGRSLSYGAGITYWPVADLVRGAAGIVDTDSVDTASGKVRALFGDAPDADELAANLDSAIGLSPAAVPGDAISWAVRRMLERLAESRPVVAVVEDIHWAEPALLDLLEEVADWTRDVPLLLLCPARPELLEVRPTWAADRGNATTLRLEALGSDATRRLIEDLPGGPALPRSVVERVVATADGNPLFVEELLAMFVDEGVLRAGPDGAWQTTSDVADVRIPPSISALLGARLQVLGTSERLTAQRASVVGREFDRSAVVELSPEPERASLPGALSGLVRKEIVRREGADPMSPAYAFRHALIREAAYEGLAKGERAHLHARFADWVERTAGERLAEVEEIVGYHLEQAHRYRRELGDSGPDVADLGERAGQLLRTSGERALSRRDHEAAVNLLGRALEHLTSPSDQARTGRFLAEAMFHVQRFQDAIDIGERSAAKATEAGLPAIAAHASLWVLGARDALGVVERSDLWEGVGEAQRAFTATGDEAGLARASMIEGYLYSHDGREAESVRATQEAARYAAAAGDLARSATALSNVADSYAFGPWPARPAIDEIEAGLPTIRLNPDSHYLAAGALAVLHAITGDVVRARAYLGERDVVAQERGRSRDRSNRIADAFVGLVAHDPAMVIDAVRDEYRRRQHAGDQQVARLHGILVGELLLQANEAAAAGDIVRELASAMPIDDVESAAAFEVLEAGVASLDGDHAAAVDHARRGVEQLDSTDWLEERALGWLRLAEVQFAAGDLAEAATAAHRAGDLFAEKGDVLSGGRAARLRAAIEAAGGSP